MDELPDLNRLSVAEKDELIHELWPLRARVRQLSEQVVTAKIAELEGCLTKNRPTLSSDRRLCFFSEKNGRNTV